MAIACSIVGRFNILMLYLFVRYLLNNPRELLARAVSYIELVKVAERVDFPDFPLYMTNSHAKQLASMLLQIFPVDYLSVDVLAQGLMGKRRKQRKII